MTCRIAQIAVVECLSGYLLRAASRNVTYMILVLVKVTLCFFFIFVLDLA